MIGISIIVNHLGCGFSKPNKIKEIAAINTATVMIMSEIVNILILLYITIIIIMNRTNDFLFNDLIYFSIPVEIKGGH
jgi:hypothetical protein